jgi:hypothetical protein
MIRRMGRSVMVGFVIGVAANGCRDATGPDGVAGNYRLERFEGMPLPAFVLRTSTGVVSMLDERILLGDDGKGVAMTIFVEVNDATRVERLIPVTRGLDYSVRDGQIQITFVCPPLPATTSASCVVGPHLTGERTTDQLALGRPVSSKPVSIYRRVR